MYVAFLKGLLVISYMYMYVELEQLRNKEAMKLSKLSTDILCMRGLTTCTCTWCKSTCTLHSGRYAHKVKSNHSDGLAEHKK